MFELISNPYILYLYVVPFFFNFGYVTIELIQGMASVNEDDKNHWFAMTLFAFALILLPVVNLIFMLYSILELLVGFLSRRSKDVK